MPSASTIMDHQRRIKRAVVHINKNLDRRRMLDRLADAACFSPFHFIRVFQGLMGESPKRYTVRKRMALAGYHLLRRKMRIIDIALSVGYETPSSFCKAFKSYYRMPPRRFRDTVSDDFLTMTNPIYLSFAGGRTPSGVLPGPSPVVRTLPPMKVACIENRGIRNGSFVPSAMASFKQLREILIARGLSRHVQAYASVYPRRVFGTDDETALNYVGAVMEDIPSPLDLVEFSYPRGRYAIFEHYGPSEFMVHTWNRAYANWLPTSGRSLRSVAPLEIHLDVTTIVSDLQLSTYLMIPIA